MTTAQERLTLALVHLAAAGRRPPCGEHGEHNLWTSEDHGERAIAVKRCQTCPLTPECHDAAEETGERHYVWGGIDRGARTRSTTT